MMQLRAGQSDPLELSLADNLDGAFERLVLEFQDRLYAFGLRLTGNRQDAEEIAQDAFVRAYHALKEYSADRIRVLALRPWLYRIALNIVRNRARGRKLDLVPFPLDGDGVPIEPEDDLAMRPDMRWERYEETDHLARLLASLPERYRPAVILRHVDGLTYVEVAAILEQPIGTVKANVHRGMLLLREALGACRDEVIR